MGKPEVKTLLNTILTFHFISSHTQCLLCTQLKWCTVSTHWVRPLTKGSCGRALKSLILIWTCCDMNCLGDNRTLYIFQLFEYHNILTWTMCGAQNSINQQFQITEQVSSLQSAAALKTLASVEALKTYGQLFSAPCVMHKQPAIDLLTPFGKGSERGSAQQHWGLAQN